MMTDIKQPVDPAQLEPLVGRQDVPDKKREAIGFAKQHDGCLRRLSGGWGDEFENDRFRTATVKAIVRRGLARWSSYATTKRGHRYPIEMRLI